MGALAWLAAAVGIGTGWPSCGACGSLRELRPLKLLLELCAWSEGAGEATSPRPLPGVGCRCASRPSCASFLQPWSWPGSAQVSQPTLPFGSAGEPPLGSSGMTGVGQPHCSGLGVLGPDIPPLPLAPPMTSLQRGPRHSAHTQGSSGPRDRQWQWACPLSKAPAMVCLAATSRRPSVLM